MVVALKNRLLESESKVWIDLFESLIFVFISIALLSTGFEKRDNDEQAYRIDAS